MTRDYSGSLDDRATAYDDWLLSEAEARQDDGESDDTAVCWGCGEEHERDNPCVPCPYCEDPFLRKGTEKACPRCVVWAPEDFRMFLHRAAEAHRVIRRAEARGLPVGKTDERDDNREEAREIARLMGWIK